MPSTIVRSATCNNPLCLPSYLRNVLGVAPNLVTAIDFLFKRGLTYILRVHWIKGAFSGLRQFLATESRLNMIKKVFFILP